MASGWGRRVRVEMQKTAVGQSPTAQSSTQYASLHTGNPGDDGQTANEVGTSLGYSRQGGASFWSTLTVYTSVTNDTASVASNANQLTFGASTGSWGTITYVGVWLVNTTSITETNYLGRALVSVSQTVGGAGVTLTIAGGGLTMGCISA